MVIGDRGRLKRGNDGFIWCLDHWIGQEFIIIEQVGTRDYPPYLSYRAQFFDPDSHEPYEYFIREDMIEPINGPW